MVKSLVPIVFVLQSLFSSAQVVPISWETLAEVTFDFKYIPEKNKLDSNPSFPAEVQALNGKKVQIRGYVIPMKADKKAYALSEFPNASCFFCGNAGLETVMELHTKNKRKSFKIDEVCTFTGTLRLSTQIEELPFVLENAVVE
ncbi:MAG: DUF3299 domain-containing protein [Bacteroidota bacterium]